jgi:Gas vesicle protein
MATERSLATSTSSVRRLSAGRSDSLADTLERVLDKGVVIVGDVVVSVLDVELLTLKLRLFISSVDTAREMGLDWWTADPFYSSGARALGDENRDLRSRVRALESALAGDRAVETAAVDGAAIEGAAVDGVATDAAAEAAPGTARPGRDPARAGEQGRSR